jgi:hypothetical protein
MINKEDFCRWFNKDFWRAFKNANFPIWTPQSKQDRYSLVEAVYTSISSSHYYPRIPEAELVLNKGWGVTRISPIFHIGDYCVYYFCIKELENVLCQTRTPNTFGGWTLGGKIRKMEHDEIENELTYYGRYSFNPLAWIKAFGEFNSLLYSQLDKNQFSHILQFDLSNFYDCVRLDILERWIREEAGREKGWIITLLFYFLNHWNRRNTGLHSQTVGLPQDALADCSRILSNYYLQKYDKLAATICAKADACYFRYADDQIILLNDPEKVEVLLLHLTKNLDRYGLRVNQKKVHLWTSEDFQQHRCRSIQEIFAKPGDNQNRHKVRKFVNAYLRIGHLDLEKTWNSGRPLLNRLLYANLRLLSKTSFNKITDRLLSKQYLLSVDHKKLKIIYDLNKKRSKPVDLVALLAKLGNESVHNAFHHEALQFAVLIKNASLEGFFKERIEFLKEQMENQEI